MNEIVIAENAGFCPGVRAATDRLARRIRSATPGERLFTLGHLIHNEDYNRDLEAAGVLVVTADQLPAIAAATDGTALAVMAEITVAGRLYTVFARVR